MDGRMCPDFLEPATLEDVCSLLASSSEDSKLIAGGTAVVLMLQQGLISPDRIVSVNRLPELEGISASRDGVRIGARMTLTDLARSAVVRAAAPALATACSRVGNVRVRNAATLGGNLAEADYASDPPTVLACLGASCTVTGSSGPRTAPIRQLIADFYTTKLDRDEVITDIVVPRPTDNERSVYLRYVSRSSEDRPCVGVAARARILPDGSLATLSIAVGAVAAAPQLHPEITDAVRGHRLDARLVEQIAEGYADATEPLDDVRGTGWYRRRIIAVLVRSALGELQGVRG
jgi:carbon-monoxide dehydrogenase medium subunit